jgi:hypothetical protein
MRPAVGVATMKSNKLLQVVVVLGASLTGGLQSTACGGAIDSGAAGDAAADSSASYGHIALGAAYGNISDDGGYGRIMPAPLDSGVIGDPDGAVGDGGGDADSSDANEDG